MDLTEIPSQHDRAAWPEFLDALNAVVDKPKVTIEEVIGLGRLYNRLGPVRDSWCHALHKHAEDRLRGLASAKTDSELERLYDLIAVTVGRLRRFAALSNAGSPEFPRTRDIEQFAAALLVEDTRARAKARADAKAAEEAAKPKPEFVWSSIGYVRSAED